MLMLPDLIFYGCIGVGLMSLWWFLFERRQPLMGRAPQWPALRRLHLEKEPTCQVCGTREELEVHHVRPVHLFPELELDPLNLLTLCQVHHLWVGHCGKWIAWNPTVRQDAAYFALRIKERRECR